MIATQREANRFTMPTGGVESGYRPRIKMLQLKNIVILNGFLY